MNGKIKWFNNQKGFGFITNENGDDVFLHYSMLVCYADVNGKIFPIMSGDKVNFDVIEDEKGLMASNVVYEGAQVGQECTGKINEYAKTEGRGVITDSDGMEYSFTFLSFVDGRDIDRINVGALVSFRSEESPMERRAVRCVLLGEPEE